MRKILAILLVGFCGVAFAAGERKEVCNEKKDAKGNVVKNAKGEPVKECRMITVHKKVEGEKVPDAKK